MSTRMINHRYSGAWKAVKDIDIRASNKKLCVDAFAGAKQRIPVWQSVYVEVAWQHIRNNMFIKPTAEELENFEPISLFTTLPRLKLKTTRN